MSALSDMIRKTFAESDRVRDLNLTVPDDITCHRNIPYGSQLPWQTLDVYRPSSAIGKILPVIVSVHGGAFVYGDKELYQYYCMSLAQRGFAVVNFSYRLAPENRFPSSLQDTCSVFQWTLDHCSEYLLDPEHIFAVGDSAGAHLLVLFTAMCTDPSFAASFPFLPPQDFVPRALALNSGLYSFKYAPDSENQMTVGLLQDLLPMEDPAAEMDQIEALNHISGTFPPVFVMTAEDDFLRSQAPMLVSKLVEQNVPTVFHYYTDPEEKPGHVFHLDMKSPLAAQCNEEECAFFRSCVK